MRTIEHARAELLSAVAPLQHIHVEYEHPRARGPLGETLKTDAIWIGPHDAPNVAIVISGTHGIEGLIGSAIQLQWLRSRQRSRSVACLIVHLLNPYGYAWSRRCDDQNVDINRNFIDFTQPLPANAEYARLADVFAPKDWFGAERQAADGMLMKWVTEVGPRAAQSVLTKGQYQYTDGLFFGGLQPSWSRETIESILRRFSGGARRLVAVDLHTGLGRYASCELIQKTGDLHTAERVMGPVVAAGEDESVATAITGSLAEWLPRARPDAEVFSFVAEFGTISAMEVLMALRADNWLHSRGDPQVDQAQTIKSAMVAAFAPDDAEWRSSVISKALEIIDQAHSLAGLGSAAKHTDPRTIAST
jgi:octopine/nopaline transport system ATP-binding protein